jgi:3-oxocholest-4-en-26-oyl-CoA dehydrogenase alpha subunit
VRAEVPRRDVLPVETETLRSLRSFLDEHVALAEGARGYSQVDRRRKTHSPEFFRGLHEAGWSGVAWPKEYGGRGLSARDQWLLAEELAYRYLPDGGLTFSSIGPTLMLIGNEQQKSRYLSGMLTGDVIFAVAYTEPDAGSDLAALRTSAILDGDEFLVNGSKVYTTAAHYATHLWLAVRTDVSVERHAGISVLIVPTDASGVTIRPLMTQSDMRTNEVFLDDVRVPQGDLVGDMNAGWSIITTALSLERLLMHGDAVHDFENLVKWAANTQGLNGVSKLSEPAIRELLAEIAVDFEIARLLSWRVVTAIDEGNIPTVEAAESKIWTSELIQHLASHGLSLLGLDGTVRVGESQAPLSGTFEEIYRFFPLHKFAAGTNEVQRDIIARRGLNIARHK